MNDEKMKKDWRETAEYLRTDSLEADAAISGISAGDRRTSLEQLQRRYQRFAILGLLMGGIFLTQIELQHEFVEILTLPGAVAMCVIMFIAGFTDIYLRDSLRRIDVQRMSITEVTRRCRRCRRIHLLFVAIMLPLALATVVYIACVNVSNTYLIAGIITGAVAGLGIGLVQLSRFLADYRNLR